ncbi:SusC/RagA family TonB-linked outer membrane protein [Subsaximicrobium wynnwilliamsii]|uniref:SusC/RagA family TonB-linked outer membrane protein n=1 Tax=Subsaximicrobium wynnwilliamsii TaxID=291179 RepID=A0A5C6ZDV6_9FLAO|nr:SusC/RagA family TonB-linked outer membrane protein [Subsaximicrobium wynnwilliamsii]TXD82297.1 SusC/RagA family TonB-linked outer membrane protein [Subsaximicrobium wynnwilliamsii]TXD87935.1 SusC/RagA family TonB-linked outer membrane protein [Subsaximicrobium wynnwilliamsii]TXE01928.1 SusC/RagA family TonB-linked outer membrane protein [Subsaximicrobium wynnwilliamsii]
MKTKFSGILTLLLVFVVQISFAQEVSVTGKVTDENGMPLPGATVVIQGTTTGASTDFDGNYAINASQGEVLEFRYVGYSTKSITVGASNVINASLALDNTLDEVVVTALGISREKKSLGYSTQQIAGEELTETRNATALNALSGRVAGVQISTPSGNLGGSTRILIRGIGSITQNNRPLIVVDGIPLDNSNYNSNSAQTGGGGTDFGDTGFDINPDDIASMNVLKGGPAAALYGNRASNGVIIITTKTGKKGKGEIVLNSGVSFETINVVPQVQKLYGGGGGIASTFEQSDFNSVNINGQPFDIVDYATDESWGPRYDPTRSVLHWDAFDPEFPNEFLQPRAWVYPKNDREDFFNTGVSVNNGVSFSSGTEKGQMRLSINNTQQTGIVPNSELDKTSFNFNGSSKITEKLEVSAGINYTVTNGFNRPAIGYTGAGVIQQFFQFGQTSVDMERLKQYQLPDGTQRTWNRIAYDNPNIRYSDNPYWTINKNVTTDKRTRYFGDVGMKYNFTDELYVTAKIYSDTYDDRRSSRTAQGSAEQSLYTEVDRDFSETNYEAILFYDTDIANDRISINSFFGTNKRVSSFQSLDGSTNGGLVVDGIYNLNNSVANPFVNDFDSRRQIESVFASASFGFDDTYYLTVTGRNDWSSTLPEANNSFFYPSLSGSVVFSEFFEADWFTFGKIRGGYAEVGGDTEPYNLRNAFASNPAFFDGIRFTQPSQNNNPNLRPENKKTWEVGLEMGFFKNRVNMDLTYYNERTEDLITPVQVDPSTGYTSTVANAGVLENKGFEALVNITPIRTDDFDWTVTWNFAKNDNELLELLPGVNSLELARFPFNGVTLNAIVGQPYGIIRGTDFVYDDNGNKVIKANGLYAETVTQQNLGSVLPDYNMGFRNSISYKNFDFSFLIDVQKGGKYRSLTNIWGHYSGILESTAANNIRVEGVVLEGVTGTIDYNDDGSYTVTNTAENTQAVPAQRWGQDHFFGADALNVFDADYVKLREVALGYTFPKKWTGDVASIRLSAFGRNLFVWGLDNENFDPEVATSGSGNIQGSEGGSLPSTRTYGLNLEIKL